MKTNKEIEDGIIELLEKVIDDLKRGESLVGSNTYDKTTREDGKIKTKEIYLNLVYMS